MIALKSVQGIFEFMGLLVETEPPWPLIHYVKNVLISIPLFTLLYPLCAYFVINMYNLVNATDAFYVIASIILCLGQYWFLVMQKQPLRCLFLELQALIDQKNRDFHVFKLFIDVEIKVFHYTRRMKAFVIFSSTICLFLPFIYSTYRLVIGEYQPEDWYLPYKMSVPFDDTTSLGYSVAYLIQLLGSAVICAIIYTINSFFFGICFYFKVLMMDLNSIFDEINQFYRNRYKNKWNNPSKYSEQFEIRKFLKKYVQTHIDVNQFIEHFGQIMSGSIFVTFAISISWICTSLFQIHSNFQNPSYLLLQSIMTTSAIILIIFIFCYFGHMVTTDSELAASSLYHGMWYNFPISLQKSMIFIMARAQHPFYLTAFKMYRCWLHSFTGIINTAFQVFMLFRSMHAE